MHWLRSQWIASVFGACAGMAAGAVCATPPTEPPTEAPPELHDWTAVSAVTTLERDYIRLKSVAYVGLGEFYVHYPLNACDFPLFVLNEPLPNYGSQARERQLMPMQGAILIDDELWQKVETVGLVEPEAQRFQVAFRMPQENRPILTQLMREKNWLRLAYWTEREHVRETKFSLRGFRAADDLMTQRCYSMGLEGDPESVPVRSDLR